MTNMVAAGISFFGTEHAISDQIDAYKHDAQVADYNADTVKQQGEASDQALDRDIRTTQGAMEASYGGSGVTMSGSPALVMADSIRKGVLDRATNKYNFDTQARNFSNQATGYRLLAHNIKRTQFMTALSAGLASFSGGNGGMGGAGTTGQTNDTSVGASNNNMWQSGNSLTGGSYTGGSDWGGGNSLTGGTYAGDESMSTSWGGEGGGWGS